MSMKSRWFKFSLLSAFSIFSIGCAKEDVMQDAILNLPKFDVNAAAPICGRWRDNMPSIRSREVYDVYINARKIWRSKQAWLFEKSENQSILNDVMFSAEKGDWGAKALLANFYRQGLGGCLQIMSSNRTSKSQSR